MSAERDLVLQVLQGQSPGYFIFPNAAAFAVEGLDPEKVARVLDDLTKKGQLERELLPAGDADEDGEQVAGGYRLIPKPDQPKRRRKSK